MFTGQYNEEALTLYDFKNVAFTTAQIDFYEVDADGIATLSSCDSCVTFDTVT